MLRNKIVSGVLIASVLIAGIYVLKSFGNDQTSSLTEFSNEVVKLDFPEDFLVEFDTTYLDNGDLFNIAQGVGATIAKDGKVTHYALSTATYSKALTAPDFFRLDVLGAKFEQQLAYRNAELLHSDKLEIDGIMALKFVIRSEGGIEHYILFSVINHVVALNSIGESETDQVFEEMIESIEVKLN